MENSAAFLDSKTHYIYLPTYLSQISNDQTAGALNESVI